MTLELNKLTTQVQAMGTALAAREKKRADLAADARRWLTEYTGQEERLRHPARAFHAAIPTSEPIDAHFSLPPIPSQFTFVAADGSQIQPDRHGTALYYLINIGSLVYRHGSGQAPDPHSQPTLGYAEDEIYEGSLLVAGNLLDVRRDLAEVTRLADLCAAQPAGPTVAAVDGTLILWVLDDLPLEGRQRKVQEYLGQLDRIRESGAGVAAFISRPRYTEVAALLHLASFDADVDRAKEAENPLRDLPDRAIFSFLPAGARSALFVSPSPINQKYYVPFHTVHFFYLNLADEGREPVIARVEVPAWVAADAGLLALVHAAVVAQARITGDYPYALARADEMAFISGPEREDLEDMVTGALLRAGLAAAISPKLYYKTLTRQGRRK